MNWKTSIQNYRNSKKHWKTKKNSLKEEKAKHVTLKEELEDVQEEFEAKVSQLEQLYADTQGMVVSISRRQGDLEFQKEANYAILQESEEELARILGIAYEADEDYKLNGSKNDNVSGKKPNSKGYIWPTDSTRITCDWLGYPQHYGIDIGDKTGSNIYAVGSGIVVDVQKWNGWQKTGMQAYGNMVRIYHPETGTYTRYAHCVSTKVTVGQYVSQGQVIAYIGSTGNSTGPHLHFEISTTASNSSRVNPRLYISS